MIRVGGIVLCGGQSTRMGRPKAWLPFAGELMPHPPPEFHTVQPARAPLAVPFQPVVAELMIVSPGM